MRRWVAAWRASRHATLLAIVAAVAVGQAVRFVVLDFVVPDFVRGGGTFLIQDIVAGTAASQTFEARDNGLEVIRLDGTVTGAGSGALDAVLIEVWAPGDERPVRRATLPLAGANPCCEIRFAPVRDSARRRYRLEFVPHDLGPDQRLSLRAISSRSAGGLTIFGRTQPANLQFDLGDVELGRLPGGIRIPLTVLMLCFAAIDAAVAWLLLLLFRGPAATSSSLRPS